MSNVFVYNWTSQSAKEYLEWLGTIQEYCKRRRRLFAWIATIVFVLGIVCACIVALTKIPSACMLIALGTSILSGFLMTDTCRGHLYSDPVGAVITNFNSMNEFDIGRFEKNSMELQLQQEVKDLLFCLRISSNLHKYKKMEVILSRWQTAMNKGRPYFYASPRGKLTLDFLTQIYFFYVRKTLTEYATHEYTAVSKLKTVTAKQNRLEKSKGKLVDILTKNHKFPQMQELVNTTYKAIAKAVNVRPV